MRKQIFILGVAFLAFTAYSPVTKAAAFQCIDVAGAGLSGPVNCNCSSGSACLGGNTNLDMTTCNVTQACGTGYSCANSGGGAWCNKIDYNSFHCSAAGGTWHSYPVNSSSDFDTSAGGAGGCCSASNLISSEIGGDGKDNDCDGLIDETARWYPDVDGDGYGYNSGQGECFSSSAAKTCNSVYAGYPSPLSYTPNIPTAGFRVDYSTKTLNGSDWFANQRNGNFSDIWIMNTTTLYSQVATVAGDCNDLDPYNWTTSSAEVCDGSDNDCDGLVDDGLTFTTYYRDNDGDGKGNPSASLSKCSPPSGYVTNNSDCNDAEPLAWTGKTEICWDNIDNDCNGQKSEIAACDFGADYKKLDNNTSANLKKFSVCNLVTSTNTGKSIFIPMKTSGEWSSFVNNFVLATVTKAVCSL